MLNAEKVLCTLRYFHRYFFTDTLRKIKDPWKRIFEIAFQELGLKLSMSINVLSNSQNDENINFFLNL